MSGSDHSVRPPNYRVARDVTFLQAAADVGYALQALWRKSPSDGLQGNGSIYDGTSGRALVCLELYRATGDGLFAEMAQSEIKRTADFVAAGSLGTGFMHGNPGVALMYHRASCILGEDRFASMALRSLERAEPAEGVATDYYSGLCGRVVIAATLFRRTGDERYRQLALRAGEVLFNRGVDSRPEGLCLRPGSLRLIPGIGLAHGASGLAIAAIELSQLTGIPEFEYFARSAVEYEDAFFSAHDANWVETRFTNNSSFGGQDDVVARSMQSGAASVRSLSPAHPTSLCNGRSGIFTARLRVLQQLGWCGAWAPDNLESERCWEGFRSPAGDYTYCCGFGGVADTLVTAASVLRSPRCLHLARMVGRESIHQADRGDWLSVWQKIPGRSFAGLMKGLSGIAYMYLRLFDPNSFPSVVVPTAGDSEAQSQRCAGDDAVAAWALRARLKSLGKYWHYTAAALSATRSAAGGTSPLQQAAQQLEGTTAREDVLRTGERLRALITASEHGPARRRAARAWQIEVFRYRFDQGHPVLGMRDYAQALSAQRPHATALRGMLTLQHDVKVWQAKHGVPAIAMYVRNCATRLLELSAPALAILTILRAGPSELRTIASMAKMAEHEAVTLIQALLHANIVAYYERGSCCSSPSFPASGVPRQRHRR